MTCEHIMTLGAGCARCGADQIDIELEELIADEGPPDG